MHDSVGWHLDGSVARVVLARPEAGNALNLAMARGLAEAARRVRDGAEEGTVRAALVAAEGRAFCVGGDLSEFARSEDRGACVAEVATTAHEAIAVLQAAPVPVVTAVHATAAGGGVGLALCGDVVLMASTAKLRLAYTAAGLSPDCGASWLLPRRIGMARALDLALTNRVVTGAEAEQWGLASRVVAPESLGAEAEAVAVALAHGSRRALAETKRLLRESSSTSFEEQLAAEAATIAALAAAPDGREGVDAFLAKRTPEFD
ncbi:MAG: enoyl-CoA hydratase/isomerase family protein [Actinobacteria bacterium]|nr:enoyl-CoA hydratase/isomerase family protein [Actinomycetota bacterium]